MSEPLIPRHRPANAISPSPDMLKRAKERHISPHEVCWSCASIDGDVQRVDDMATHQRSAIHLTKWRQYNQDYDD
jgi:hypothetical protein